MRNPYPITKSLLALAVVGASLSACKDDDSESSKPVVTFSRSTLSASEANGTIEVEVELDKAASQDITVTYDLSGTARDRESGGAANYDYTIADTPGEITIEKGETSAVIEIALNDDGLPDNNETIVLTLDDVDGDRATIGDDNEITITIADGVTVPQVSFAMSEIQAVESDGIVEVQVTVSSPSPTAITVTYTLGGTALDEETADEQDRLSDYSIANAGTLTIPANQTTATIEVKLESDILLEDDLSTTEVEFETIDLTITAVSQNAAVSANNAVEIQVTQEAGFLVFLHWGWDEEQEEHVYTDVDMDLILWEENASGVLRPTQGSFASGFDEFEFVFLGVGLADGNYGLSYNYTAGTEDPMHFNVDMIIYEDGVLTDQGIPFEAAYGINMVNNWQEPSDLFISQTFTIEDGFFDEFSEISTTRPDNARQQVAKAGMRSVLKNSLTKPMLGNIDIQKRLKR